MEHIVIIGGGGTGAALAHDLVLRGFDVSLFERGELLSGTTGRHHGLLHSGGRYAVNDPVAAKECIRENKILRRIAPEAIEQNGGLFVALSDIDMDYRPSFLEKCKQCGISTDELTPHQALAIEPALHPDIKTAIRVPDATLDAWRLPLHFYATAKANGARIHNFSQAIGFHKSGGTVTGVRIFDHQSRTRIRCARGSVCKCGRCLGRKNMRPGRHSIAASAGSRGYGGRQCPLDEYGHQPASIMPVKAISSCPNANFRFWEPPSGWQRTRIGLNCRRTMFKKSGNCAPKWSRRSKKRPSVRSGVPRGL